MSIPIDNKKRPSFGYRLWAILMTAILSSVGCAVQPTTLSVKNNPIRLAEGSIYDTASMAELSFEALIGALGGTRVVYVGETHTNPAHHAVQLAVIKAMNDANPDLIIGMEMFDHTYQPVLDQWTAGALSENEFIERTHWYANWRFNYDQYRDILEYAKEKGIRIIALNVPFHIPGKIRAGGISSLSEEDRRHLPETIDTNITDHRAYVEEIFNMHSIPGRSKFDYFYEAQCTWEDTMAEAVSDHLGSGKMVVLVGNGHIIRKFGIPDRAFDRTNAPFKTIYTVSVGAEEADPTWGDYLWITTETPMPRMGMKHGKMKK